MRRFGVLVGGLVVALAASGCSSSPVPEDPSQVEVPPVSRAQLSQSPAHQAVQRAAALPLRGIVIALDPGHQLGNSRFPRQTGALVEAGGFRKPCNTTGTATRGGTAESTVTFRISTVVKRRLEALGATVRMTRTSNSADLWGPCVDARGRFGAKVGAQLMVSLHADGAATSARGFHVIVPTSRAPWTTDIARPSKRLGRILRDRLGAAGVPRSTYVGSGTGLVTRSDLGTLNLSDVPVAMIEMGNMKNASDARRLTTRQGRAVYARAIVSGIRATLGR